MSDKTSSQFNVITDIKAVDPNKILYITTDDGNIYVLNKDKQVKKSCETTKNKSASKKDHQYDSKKLSNEHKILLPEKLGFNTIQASNFCRKTSPENLTLNRDKYFINSKTTNYKPSNSSQINYSNYNKGKPFENSYKKIGIEFMYYLPLNKGNNHNRKSKIINNTSPKLKIMNSHLYPDNNYNRNNQINIIKIGKNENREKANIISEKINHNFFERKVIRNKSPGRTPEKYRCVRNKYIFLNEEEKPYFFSFNQPVINNFSINKKNTPNDRYNSKNIIEINANFDPNNYQNIQNINDTNSKKSNNTEQKVSKEITFQKVVTFGEIENNDKKNNQNQIKESLNKVGSIGKRSKNYETSDENKSQVNKVFTFGDN